jgi:ribose 5-phosphate isomerase B
VTAGVSDEDGEEAMKPIGIAADHGGFAMKAEVVRVLETAGYPVRDFGAESLDVGDDYPDYVVPLARAVSSGEVARGIAICGSGVGATVVANKIPGVRAALVMDMFSAHQGVEDDDMNILCLGGRVCGPALLGDLVRTFLAASFSGAERHRRRLAKVAALEHPAVTGRTGEYREEKS